jgi:excisionase family DNA binding protein
MRRPWRAAPLPLDKGVRAWYVVVAYNNSREGFLPEELEGYITVPEVAQKMGRSTEQVRRYLREGKLSGRRIGGQWFIREPAVLYLVREEKIGMAPRASDHREGMHAMDVRERLVLFERVNRRREEIRRRWETLGVRVDAAELVREVRDEER